MRPAELPRDEQDRIGALIGLKVLDTPAEDRFDRITRIAAQLFRVPIAVVSMVDRGRQWFKSSHGMDVHETPRDLAFSAHTILEEDVFEIPNAANDLRFSDNPLVVYDPGIRFYAGCPLRSPNGFKVGDLGIADTKPRMLERDKTDLLRDLAHVVESELSVERFSAGESQLIAGRQGPQLGMMVDPLTRFWNREAILEVLRYELGRVRRGNGIVGGFLVEVDGFEALSREAADHILHFVARWIRSWTRGYDTVGRYTAGTFLAVMPGCGKEDAWIRAQMLQRIVSAVPLETPDGKRVRVTLSVGAAEGRNAVGELIGDAERALRKARKRGEKR